VYAIRDTHHACKCVAYRVVNNPDISIGIDINISVSIIVIVALWQSEAIAPVNTAAHKNRHAHTYKHASCLIIYTELQRICHASISPLAIPTHALTGAISNREKHDGHANVWTSLANISVAPHSHVNSNASLPRAATSSAVVSAELINSLLWDHGHGTRLLSLRRCDTIPAKGTDRMFALLGPLDAKRGWGSRS
jgi:hypothetical protein